jgi:hypothetical protein
MGWAPHVVDLSIPGWTITEQNVEKMAGDLSNVLDEGGDVDMVVISTTSTCPSTAMAPSLYR